MALRAKLMLPSSVALGAILSGLCVNACLLASRTSEQRMHRLRI
jgi:hypothetical protein